MLGRGRGPVLGNVRATVRGLGKMYNGKLEQLKDWPRRCLASSNPLFLFGMLFYLLYCFISGQRRIIGSQNISNHMVVFVQATSAKMV